MGVTIATVQTTCDTAGGGTQNITTTDLGGLTPKAAVLIVSGATTLDTAAAGARLGVGFTDGTNQFSFSIQSEDGQGTTDTDRRSENDELVSIMLANGLVDGEANFSAFIANGITIAWGDYPASAYYITAIFFAGTDVSAYCGSFTPNTTQNSSVDVTTVGFEPDVVLFLYNHIVSIPDKNQHAILSFGAAVNDGADSQACTSSYWLHGQATTDNQLALFGSYAFGFPAITVGEIGTFDADGFTCTTRLGNNLRPPGFLALNFNSVITAGLDVLTTPTSTGNQAFTVSLGGETPQLAIMGMTKADAIDTVYTDSRGGTAGFYVCDADDEASHAVQDEDGQATSDTQSYAAAKATLDDHDGTGLFDASFVSFAADMVRLNFQETDSTARKWWCLSFGSEAAAAAPSGGESRSRYRSALGGWPTGEIPNGPFRLNHNSPQAKGLVAWWPPLGSQGRPLRDLSGYGDNMAFPGGTANPVWTPSEMGYVLSYDGSDDYLSVSSDHLNLTGTVTLSAWVTSSRAWDWNNGAYIGILARNTVYDNGFGLHMYEDPVLEETAIYMWTRGATFGEIGWNVEAFWATNTWYHVVGVYDGTNSYVYVNGLLRNSGATPTPTSTAGDSTWIGREANASAAEWPGLIGDTRVYDRVLSANEVYALWAPDTRFELYQPVRRVWGVRVAAAAAAAEPIAHIYRRIREVRSPLIRM
jgi:hypothetical protein